MATKAPGSHEPMTRDTSEAHYTGRKVQGVDPTRGGWITKRPATTDARLILNFDPAKCCSVGPGFTEDNEHIPETLAERGVTEYQSADFMQRLQRDVQKKHWNVCICLTVGFTVIGLPLVCYVESKYQEAAKKWIQEFNKEVRCS